MKLLGVSINHKTSPIEVREAFHLSRDEIINFIPILKESLFTQGIILSTCNRTEIFGLPKSNDISCNNIIEHIINYKNSHGIRADHFKEYFSRNAVKHLLSVASGIDSLILGDSQILGQVKEAFQLSEDHNFSGTVMRRIIDTSIRVGKRAIHETELGKGAVTVSYAAVQIIEKIFTDLSTKKALIIGAGETGELAAIHLYDRGVENISISNRTVERAKLLAEKISGKTIPFDEIKNQLFQFDIIVSATSSEEFIVDFDDVKTAMKKRRHNPIVITDIAIPRDVNPKVKKLDNVFYNDIDSLHIIIDENLRKRKIAVPIVEKIIREEMSNLFAWYNTLEVVPTIKVIRDFFKNIEKDELEKIKHKVSEEDYRKIEEMTKRLLGRILHNPTIKLRKLAESGTHHEEINEDTMILRELFGLENQPKNGTPKNDNEEIN